MLVPVPVIAHGAFLRDQHRVVQTDDALLAAGREEQFDGVDRLAHIPAAGSSDPPHHAGLDLQRFLTPRIQQVDGPQDGLFGIRGRDGLELKDRRTAQNRPEHAEVGILGRGGDQRDASVLDKLQQALLLFFIEVLNLIQIQQHAARRQEGVQLVDDAFDVGNPGGGGVQLAQAALGPLGDDARDGGFPGPGRPVENHVRRTPALHDPPQQAVPAENMLLSDHVVQAPRPDLIRQRLISAVHVSLLGIFRAGDQRSPARRFYSSSSVGSPSGSSASSSRIRSSGAPKG